VVVNAYIIRKYSSVRGIYEGNGEIRGPVTNSYTLAAPCEDADDGCQCSSWDEAGPRQFSTQLHVTHKFPDV
jgi:hypothetical protein